MMIGMSVFMIFAGGGLLLMGILDLVSRRFFDWWNRTYWGNNDYNKEEHKDDYIYNRYVRLISEIGSGSLFLLGGIFTLSYRIIPEPKEVWLSTPFLILGFSFAILGLLTLLSKKFNSVLWRVLWRSSHKKLDRIQAGITFLIISSLLFFGYYLFSSTP